MGLSNFASTFETTSEKESSSTVPKDAGDHVVAVDTLSSPQQTAARRRKEIYGNTITDPVLAQKMELVNDAIDEIGMTPFHWKLFFLNGFGYAVESLLIACASIANPAVTKEYGIPIKQIAGIPMASQVGFLVGAALWGTSADIIGRRLVFNASLFLSASFVLIGGAMPGYVPFSVVVAIYSAAAGGAIVDAANLLEFLPGSYAWLVTLMSIWLEVGYVVSGLLAWVFLGLFSCAPDVKLCRRTENMGWRYLHFTCGAAVLLLGVLRITIVRLVQTPKWLVSQNRDEEVIEILRGISTKYDKPLILTLEQLKGAGNVQLTENSVWSGIRMRHHYSALFETRKLAWSTTLIIAIWFVIGLATPLYVVFLPYYLASRGAAVGDNSNFTVWRNYAITHVAGLSAPIIATLLVETKYLGRRGTLCFGALATMALQFGYTQITTPAQNLAFAAAISVALGMLYGTLLAYTSEILPAAHRATGYGICIVFNHIAGIAGIVVGSYANVETTVPLFVCASLSGLVAILSLLLPLEPRGKRTQ